MDLDVQSYNLGHLGIVAGIFDALKLDEIIDRVLPKQPMSLRICLTELAMQDITKLV